MEEAIQLRVAGLTKRYENELVLHDVSFSVRKGEVVVILGPSGCGKSTLLRCINGLEAFSGGEVLVDGEPVVAGGKNITRLRQKIGMVFQSYELFPHKTILENVTLAPQVVQGRARAETEAEAEALLRRVGLWEKRAAYPRQLSGGQKQRVAIVRSLIMHPEILLFDEVTAALDPEMVREVLDVILELAGQGLTMLIVTHEMSFARAIADRVLFLDGGGIAEQAPPEQFFTAPATPRAQEFLRTFTFSKRAPAAAG